MAKDESDASLTLDGAKLARVVRSTALVSAILIISSIMVTLLMHFVLYSSIYLGPVPDSEYHPSFPLTLDHDFKTFDKDDNKAIFTYTLFHEFKDENDTVTFKMPRGTGRYDSWVTYFGKRVQYKGSKDDQPNKNDIMELPFNFNMETYFTPPQFCWQQPHGNAEDSTCKRCDACDEDACVYYITIGPFSTPQEREGINANAEKGVNKIVIFGETSFHEWCPIGGVLMMTLFVLPAVTAFFCFLSVVFVYSRSIGLFKWRDRPVGRMLSFWIGLGVGFVCGPFAWILECICNDGSRLFVSGVFFGHYLLGNLISFLVVGFVYLTRLYELLLFALLINIGSMSFALMCATLSFDCMFQIDYHVTKFVFGDPKVRVQMEDVANFRGGQDIDEGEGGLSDGSNLDLDLDLIDDTPGGVPAELPPPTTTFTAEPVVEPVPAVSDAVTDETVIDIGSGGGVGNASVGGDDTGAVTTDGTGDGPAVSNNLVDL